MKKIFLVSLIAVFFCSSTGALNAMEEILAPSPGVTVSMDLKDASLKDVLKILSIQSGMNFIASEAVADRTLTLYLDKVSLKETMDKIFLANNLSYELDKNANIYIVKDWGKPHIETVTKVFYLKYATVSSSSLKEEMKNNIPGTSVTPGVSSSSTSSTSSSTGGGGAKWGAEDEAGITKAVKKILTPMGSLVEDYRTNSLVVTDVPDRMPVLEQVIMALDIPVQQVMLEVEMLDVSKNVVDQLGVSWPQTLVQFTVPGSRETSFPFGSLGTGGRGRTIDPDTGVFGGPGAGWDFGPWAANHFGPSILTVIGSTLTLDYLRTQTDTRTLARPRILTLNNETAEIRITTNEAIGVQQNTSSAGGGSAVGTTTVEAERAETGVILRVTPQVNIETGEITMFLLPSVTDANQTSTVTTTLGSALPTLVTYTFKNPETRSSKSTVKIKDGETVIIGGLIRNERTETISKLPILGDIPIIGNLFKHKSLTPNKERELLVFITPHIIKDGNVKLAQASTGVFAQREQSTVSGIDRQAAITGSLDKYEKKQR